MTERPKGQYLLRNVARELLHLFLVVAKKSISQPHANEHDGADGDFSEI